MAQLNEYLNDITYIRDIRHIAAGPWHQYDVLLAARGYGWVDMLRWADYMASAEIVGISQVQTAVLSGMQPIDITDAYNTKGLKLEALPECSEEQGMLSIAGMSRTTGAPMKIVWFNQTAVLRFFTTFDDELLMTKYAETVVRRTFGTPDAMKLGKPIPEGR